MANFPVIDDIGVIGYTPQGGCVVVRWVPEEATEGAHYRMSFHAQDGMPATSSGVFDLEQVHREMELLNLEWIPLEEID